MQKFILILIFILWNILHISFLKLNEILKVADSFAYLQMAYNLKNFSIEWFWNGWFWFLYSLPIAITDFFVNNDMISAFILNIILFNILVLICYIFARNFLSEKYNYLFLILLFLSPVLLNFNINILSENIYIPLFMILFIWIINFFWKPTFWNSIFLWLITALLYLTRWEAFIYVWSIWLIYLFLLFSKKIDFSRFLSNSITLIISFFVFISPYIFYMHSFTWEIWLTNKWSSNLRQAELRWTSKMDDDWFEQAVWELTEDNHHLIAWFAWWLKYEKPQTWESFKKYLLENPWKVVDRMLENQSKLYTQNLPNIIIWNAYKLYSLEWSKLFYQNKLFLLILLIPIWLLFYGIFYFIKEKEYYFVFSIFSFFTTASFFFTLFFVLDRYFVIFIPLFIFLIVYWSQNVTYFWKKWIEYLKYFWVSMLLIWIYSLWTFSYYNSEKWQDNLYEVKKEAWEWLYKYHGWILTWKTDLKIMERFPVVTYYSWTKERWLTPYTENVESLVEYAKFNNIDYLIVDNLDFYKYRPELRFLFDENTEKYEWLKKVQVFEKNWEKVILYSISKY